MLNFRRPIEFLFKSFDISGDTKMIEKLQSEEIRFLMLIKRHWIYGVLNSWRVIFVIIIAFFNAWLLVFSDREHTLLGMAIGIFLLVNVFYWVVIICIYLFSFYKIQGSEPYIEDIYSCLKKSKENDIIFTRFFNQTIFLFLTLVGITIFSSFTSIASFINSGDITGGAAGFGLGAVNTLLLMVQLGLFYSYLQNMVNLEMDFNIIVPGKILFYNQNGILGSSQSMNSNKIKTMNTKYSGMLGSFFNYGDIIVLSEGDQKDNGEMKMDYIGNPTKTVKEIQKVITNDIATMEKEVNLMLKKFKDTIGIDDVNSQENKEKLKVFLHSNEDMIKQMYAKADDETRREIKELYILIQE